MRSLSYTLSGSSRFLTLSITFISLFEVLCWYYLFQNYNLFTHIQESEFAFDKISGHFFSRTIQETFFVFILLCILAVLKIILIKQNTDLRIIHLLFIFLPIISGIFAGFAMYPVGGLDLFHYIFKAKMMAEYNANPYIQIARNVAPMDPLYIYDPFPNHTLGYGPLWTLFAKWTFRLTTIFVSSGTMLSQVIGFKVINLVFIAATSFLIWQNRPDRHSKILALVIFPGNPLVIFELISNAHNDAMLVFFLLAALLLLKKGQPMSLLAFTASLLIKPFALILLPLGVVYAVTDKSVPLKKWLSACALSLLLFLLCWIPFLDSPKLPAGFIAGMQHANAIETASILSLLMEGAELINLPGWISSLLFVLCVGLTLLSAGLLILRFLQGDSLLQTAAATYLVFCAIMTNMLPWYLVFVIAAAAFSKEWAELAPAYLFTFLGLSFYLLSVWAWYDSGSSTFFVHMLQGGFLTFPILLYAIFLFITSLKRVNKDKSLEPFDQTI